MTKYELDSLVSILNSKLYTSYAELLKSNGFYLRLTEADGAFEYEDFLTPDEHHCITHVMEFSRKCELISDHWEVTY